jgi:hypothetical protein
MGKRRSVLVAGMHDEENQYTRYVSDWWLDFEHLPEIRGGHIPTKQDCVIVAAAIASHSLYQSVKSSYNEMGKPIFLSKQGISEIKKEFELWAFGDQHVLDKMRQKPAAGVPAMPMTLRVAWLLGNFIEIGDSVKLKDLLRFFDRNVAIGHEKAIGQAWYKFRELGYLTELSTGSSTFNGLSEAVQNNLKTHGLTIKEDNLMAVVMPKAKGPIVFQKEEPKVEVVDTENSASTELLLEAMVRSQDEVRALKEFIEVSIPRIIKDEMRGISTMLGSLVPKLNGLAPDQIQKVDQMLDLFLSMRSN